MKDGIYEGKNRKKRFQKYKVEKVKVKIYLRG